MLHGGVTPLILTFNEEANIGRVLERLTWADQVVVLDSYSTDGTLAIARSFPNVVVHQRPFDSFAGQCNHGLTLVGTEWVLSLDADYVLSSEVVDEIQALRSAPDVAGYRASFVYCVEGRPLRGTLYPPRTVLYRRDCAAYVQDGHAHHVVVDGAVRELAAPILHDDRKPLASWLSAQARYAREEAAKLRATPSAQLSRADRVRERIWLAPILAPLYALVVKGGLFDGRAGWHYALQRAYAELLLSLHLLSPGAPPTPTPVSDRPPPSAASAP